MSSLDSNDRSLYRQTEANRLPETDLDLSLPGALPFLLQPDPEAVIEVELVDQPMQLPTQQFEALLVDSECEV
jgi:hypothetical protein